MGDGWFVESVRDLPWLRSADNAACVFEDEDRMFPELGYTLAVLPPGQSGGLYHSEATQEDFLVLSGECVLLIEGEERRLKAWDFVHCPAGTLHAFVGAGDEPCVIFMCGSRRGWPEKGIVYPRSELALRHGVGAEQETTSPAEAYSGRPKWKPGRPDGWERFPWA